MERKGPALTRLGKAENRHISGHEYEALILYIGTESFQPSASSHWLKFALSSSGPYVHDIYASSIMLGELQDLLSHLSHLVTFRVVSQR